MTALWRRLNAVPWPLRSAVILLLVLSVFAGLVWRAESARRMGTEVVLETRPIDPRDVFFGHYAILNYTLSGTNIYEHADAALRAAIQEGLTSGKSVYVALRRHGSFHRPVAASLDRDALPQDLPVLRGRVASGAESCAEDGLEGDCSDRLRLDWDLPGRYYADPETAMALESEGRRIRLWRRCYGPDAPNDPQEGMQRGCERVDEDPPFAAIGVILSVDEEGRAVLAGLYLAGDRRLLETLTGPRLVPGNETG
jgi:hypothetical protein